MGETLLKNTRLPRLAEQPYTTKEAAAHLRMSPRSVYRLIVRGKLKRCHEFGHIRIPAKDVETFYDRTSGYDY